MGFRSVPLYACTGYANDRDLLNEVSVRSIFRSAFSLASLRIRPLAERLVEAQPPILHANMPQRYRCAVCCFASPHHDCYNHSHDPALLAHRTLFANPFYVNMSERLCAHPDIRKFNGIRCCLACGEAVFEASLVEPNSTDTATQYRYTKLNYKLGLEIRLVVLAPGTLGDPLRCDIIHVNLEDKPEYDAVSYTWATESGDASFSKTIQCVNGGFIPVTVNCDAVLRQLRRPGLRRRLWIDAICT
jgi:hypothetical protein